MRIHNLKLGRIRVPVGPFPLRVVGLVSLAVLQAACSPKMAANPPPSGRLYYPTGLVFARPDPMGAGYLYVANSNFDRRYDFGSVTAIALDRLNLPGIGSVSSFTPLDFTDLKLGPNSEVFIQSFAGEMASEPVPASGAFRLFVPSRAEGNYLHAIAVDHDQLECQGAVSGDRNCINSAMSLSAAETTRNVKPRAPQPLGIAVKGSDVWIAHIQPADDPVGSSNNVESFLVRASTADVHSINFYSVGQGGSNSLVVGDRYIFFSGRFTANFQRAIAVRALDTTNRAIVLNPDVEDFFHVNDARGIALSTDQRRLFIVGRSPDTLLVVTVDNSDSPAFFLLRALPLPLGADEITVINRADGTDLVAITCSTDNDLVLYDDRSGQLVADIPSVGVQPYAIAVDKRDIGGGRQAARLFVTSFGDGRIIAVDIPDLNFPQLARVVARLGLPHTCIVEPKDASCQ